MKPAPFDYTRPRDLDEALRLLADSNGAAKPVAGGQSLVPMLNLRLAAADHLVDLGSISALSSVREQASVILYGAMVRHAQFEDGAVPDASNGLMRHVASRFAFRAVRTRGTIGGALALADPAADWLPTIIALNAIIHVVGSGGRRSVPAEDFVLGPYFTTLEDGELIEWIEVPRLEAGAAWGYSKVAAKAGEYAASMAIAIADPDRRSVSVVLGATDGAPIVIRNIEFQFTAEDRRTALTDAIRSAIAASSRSFSPAKLTMHTTTAARAIRDAATR